jgi:hypothetical protein
MRAEEIKGLIEAYSKVHETPEVINEELLDEAPMTDFQAGGGEKARGGLPWWKQGFDGGRGAIEARGREALYKKAGGDAAILKGPTVNRNGVQVTSLTKDDIINRGRNITTPRPRPAQTSLYDKQGNNIFDGTPRSGSPRPTGGSTPPPRPTGGSTPPPRPPASTTVLAKKGGVEGKLDKSTGKFTAGAFSNTEKSRYASVAAKNTGASTSAEKPSSTPTTPQRPAGSAMNQWRAANPKLAAAADEKSRIRGTAQTDNPLMKDMRSKMSMTPSVQSPTLAKDLGKGSGNQSLLDNPNSAKAALPKPVTTATPKLTNTSPTMKKENVDLFDLVKGHLLDEGYADTEENALVIMANMSEEWRNSIVEAQKARENPEGHDKEEKKKYEPVRGERTPMPPRGDKRREDFEKWYRANVR